MKSLLPLTIAFTLAACTSSKLPAGQPSASDGSANDAGAAGPDAADAATPARLTWTGFSTPESVLYDDVRDRYLVSNIDGDPLGEDGKGFISELSPDGQVVRLRFIDSTAAGRLNAPKGMAIHAGTLHVADIDRLRSFDVVTGAPTGEVVIPGATFLNDVTVAPDGRIWVTDSGLKTGASGFESSGTEAVWRVENGTPTRVAASADLKAPNGILWNGAELLVVTFNAAEAFALDASGVRQRVTSLPAGGLDGIVQLGDELLVSSWEGNAIFRGKLGGAFVPFISGVSAAADITVDTKRQRLLVPRFTDNRVEAFDLR